jgi:hypothetical protein
MFIESIKSWLVILDSWVVAFIEGFNTFDNNAISMAANVTRVDSDMSMPKDMMFLGPIGLILAFTSLAMDGAYNYRYRNTWDAYLRRELDRLKEKLVKHLSTLSFENDSPRALSDEDKRAFEKFAALLAEYERDTANLRNYLEQGGLTITDAEISALKTVEKAIKDLKQLLANLDIQLPIDMTQLLARLDIQPPRLNPNSKQTDKNSKEHTSSNQLPELLFLQKEAKHRKAKMLDHLEDDPYLGLAQFSDSPWFKVPFAYAWGYWFVFFFTMWGIASAFAAVPLTWAFFAFICPVLYLGYKEIVRYQTRFLEETIDPTKLKIGEQTLNLSEAQIEWLLQCRPQELVVLTQKEIDSIDNEAQKEGAQKRRHKVNTLCEAFKVNEEKLKTLWQKAHAWKNQQDQTVLFGFKGFRAGWVFVAAVAGLSASIIYGFSAAYAPLLGLGVFAGVLLVAFAVTRILDFIGEDKARNAHENTANNKLEAAKHELEKKETEKLVAATAASTKDWAFIREQWQKKMMLELSAIERAIALDKWKKSVPLQWLPEDVPPGSNPSKVKPIDFGDRQSIRDKVGFLATRLEKVRGILITGLEFAVGYMFACIIGFVALDFLGHLAIFQPFVDNISSNLLVGALGFLSGASSARRAWLNEQFHLSDLDLMRLNKDYLEKQDTLNALNDTNATLRDRLRNTLKNAIEFAARNAEYQAKLRKLQPLIEKPTKKFELKARKVLKGARYALFVLTSLSTVMLMSRALIVMGFTKAYAAPTVGGSLALFGSIAAGPSPLGIAVLSLAAIFFLWRIANKMYMALEKEQEIEKIACIDRRLDEAEKEHKHLLKAERIINAVKSAQGGIVVGGFNDDDDDDFTNNNDRTHLLTSNGDDVDNVKVLLDAARIAAPQADRTDKQSSCCLF